MVFMERNLKMIISLAVVILVVVSAGVFWFLSARDAAAPPVPPEEPSGLGAQIFDQTTNPAKERLPNTNPFSADTNPFDANINPYQDEYKNPF